MLHNDRGWKKTRVLQSKCQPNRLLPNEAKVYLNNWLASPNLKAYVYKESKVIVEAVPPDLPIDPVTKHASHRGSKRPEQARMLRFTT